MLTAGRAVLLYWLRNGQCRRGSGLHVAGRYVLTADHCAEGSGHRVVLNGREYAATVHLRSGSAAVDVAVLAASDLPPVQPLGCARVDRAMVERVPGCRAVGFPVWKGTAARPVSAQADGFIPTAEDIDPRAVAGAAPPMTLKITTPQIRDFPVLAGALDQPGSQWAGMSGAVVVSADDRVVGVVRSHAEAEGVGSLTLTPLTAIDTLPADTAAALWASLGVADPRDLPTVPVPALPGPVLPVSAGQVVVGEIPRRPVGFMSRQTVEQLALALRGGSVAVVCALTGLRGVGKTQVAAAYARARAEAGCRLVGWVNAESGDELVTGLARIAEAVGVADPDGDSLASARRLRAYLQTRDGDGLLVFDNAVDPDRLRPVLPATGRVQVVITSTDQAFAEFGQTVEVASFTRPESLEYLTRRTGLDDQPGADAVAGQLGDLPLALAQAAATIRGQRLTYPRYLQRLQQMPVTRLLSRWAGQDYPKATAAALLLSIQTTESSDPTGLTGQLLRTIAALSADGVQRGLLDGLAGPDQAGDDSDSGNGPLPGRC